MQNSDNPIRVMVSTRDFLDGELCSQKNLQSFRVLAVRTQCQQNVSNVLRLLNISGDIFNVLLKPFATTVDLKIANKA